MAAATLTSSLDLFLLGLINSGVDTPYLFRERARLSVGATLPALRRLENMRLITRGKRLLRNKQLFKLTVAGRRALKTELQHFLQEYRKKPPNDMESILRVASLGLAAEQDSDVIAILRRSAEARTRRPSSIEATDYIVEDIAASHKYLLAFNESKRLEAEAEVLLEIVSDIEGLTLAPQQVSAI
jgi:DNA-binding PadR family transcriptional regulator